MKRLKGGDASAWAGKGAVAVSGREGAGLAGHGRGLRRVPAALRSSGPVCGNGRRCARPNGCRRRLAPSPPRGPGLRDRPPPGRARGASAQRAPDGVTGDAGARGPTGLAPPPVPFRVPPGPRYPYRRSRRCQGRPPRSAAGREAPSPGSGAAPRDAAPAAAGERSLSLPEPQPAGASRAAPPPRPARSRRRWPGRRSRSSPHAFGVRRFAVTGSACRSAPPEGKNTKSLTVVGVATVNVCALELCVEINPPSRVMIYWGVE